MDISREEKEKCVTVRMRDELAVGLSKLSRDANIVESSIPGLQLFVLLVNQMIRFLIN